MCVGVGGIVSLIPMPALVAVTIFVAYATFHWHSIKPATLSKMPSGETVVMVLTVATDNLAIGVGVLASMAIFAPASRTCWTSSGPSPPTAPPSSTESGASCSSPPTTS